MDVISYGGLLSGCGQCGKWREVLALQEAMRRSAVESNQVASNAVISGLEEAAEWDKALRAFRELPVAGVVAVNSGIAAAARGVLWQVGVGFLEDLLQLPGVRPTLVSASRALNGPKSRQNGQDSMEI